MSLLKLAVSIVVCFLAGAVGTIFTTSSIPTWYASINKPSFNPPNWIFGPVWSILYIMMGISAALIWQKGWENPAVRIALTVFAIQLILNSLWSVLFFGWHSPLYGFICIIFLWLAILLTIIKFFALSSPAGWLLIPYILWVSFASILNYSILVLNR
jgi:benzodiazapine receptor